MSATINVFIALLFACMCIDARASTSFESLLTNAVRYGDSEIKRENKDAARKELFERGGESLRFVMTKIHYDNVGIQVLAQNLVDALTYDEAAPVLLDFVDDSKTNTQKSAIYFLGYYRVPEYADRITPLLADDKLRGVAIRTLGKWGVTGVVPRIARCLKDENERVRVAAANALRDIGDPRAIPALIDAQGDPVFTVRNTALRALVSFQSTAEKPMIAALEKSTDTTARRQLIRGLGEMRSETAARPLRRYVESDDPRLRADARRALRFIAP